MVDAPVNNVLEHLCSSLTADGMYEPLLSMPFMQSQSKR